MKKIISILLVFMLLVSALVSGAALAEEKELSVVVTIFPIYDWVHEIIGTRNNVNITLLLDNGVDLHSYQPTPKDILMISTADLFIYVGGESDEWVEDVLESAMNPNLKTVNLVEAMGEDIKLEEIVEGMEHDHDHEDEEHEHDEDHEHDEEHEHDEDDEEDDEHDHDHDHEHESEPDEHVWLSLRNAQKLVKVIAATLTEIDSSNADLYQANAAAYAEKLEALDARYAEAVANAEYKTLLFGDRFPFRYLTDDYNLTYYAAFSGCSAETEASFQTVVFLAQKVDELKLPAVLTLEKSNAQIANTIVRSSAAKNQKILALNSMQGATMKEIQDGMTYYSIMEMNLAVLEEALNN